MDSTNLNLKCQVCHNSEFTINEGFYYCLECGTQTEQIRYVEVAQDDDVIVENKLFSRQKIRKDLTITNPEPTTWECFNYYLKGLVDEMINLGAKEELKLTTLQLWSTFLRKNEVAFFNTKQSQLPKLGPCYSQRDAKILYNHKIMNKKLKKKAKTKTTGRGAWKRQRKNLAQSEYDSFSASYSEGNSTFTSLSKLNSSTATTRPARLTFSNSARKHYKKRMSAKHIGKHEMDDEKILLCHELQGNKNSLPRKLRELQLNRKTIYTLLYIALNIIEDDIQLCDMLRYLNEGHLSIIKIGHFFPENIAKTCEKITDSGMFTSRRSIFLDNQIRQHVVTLCKFLYIPELKLPNLITLVQRYCKDFCLPNEIFLYAERMINLSKPEMKFRFELTNSPYYEARALAYIIFILKLLFGLDDYKENIISKSASIINEKLRDLQLKELFVWNDWVKYIEMRKILLEQCHLTTSNQSKNYVNHEHYIEQLVNESKFTDEDIVKYKRNNIRNMNSIFEQFVVDKKPSIQLTEFRSTLTPQSDYLTAILKDPPNNVYIPEFLKVDHSTKDIHTFLNPKKIKTLLKKKSINLKCVNIDGKEQNHNYFKIYSHWTNMEKRSFRDIGVRLVEFDIYENEWLEKIQKNFNIENQNFLIPCKKKKRNDIKKKSKTIKDKRIDNSKIDNLNNSHHDTDLLKPRRNIENENNIFSDLSDDNLTDDNEYDNLTKDNNNENLTLYLSCLNYWLLFGKINRLTNLQFSEVQNKFPYTFLWLIETFSQYLGIDQNYLYEELSILENHFIYVLDNMQNIKNMLIFKSVNDDKELARLIDHYKLRW